MLHWIVVSIVLQFARRLGAFSNWMRKLNKLSMVTTNQSVAQQMMCASRCFSSVISCHVGSTFGFSASSTFLSFEFHSFSQLSIVPFPLGVRWLCHSSGGVLLAALLRNRSHVKTNDKSINKIYEDVRKEGKNGASEEKTILVQRTWQHRGRSSTSK